MSDLKAALIKLESAVAELENMDQGLQEIKGQADLFLKEGERDYKARALQEGSNVHVLTREELQSRLNNVIGQVENLLQEGTS